MYSLAVRDLFPAYSNRVSEFLFLKFDLDLKAKKTGIVRMEPLDPDELVGFELQLTEIQKYLDNFTERDAKYNYAARKGFPSDNSFTGKLLCGFASKKGELKKDGNPKWHCSMKFDFFYYEVYNSEGTLKRISLKILSLKVGNTRSDIIRVAQHIVLDSRVWSCIVGSWSQYSNLLSL